jgi:hypothetical protein
MTTSLHAFLIDGRPATYAGKVFGELRIAELAAGLRPRSSNLPLPGPMAGGWTPAHSEAARFLGECVAAGALLGLATELARPVWEQRHG